MFRIENIFESETTTIIKIEGEITDKDLFAWTKELEHLISISKQQTILETCDVTFISQGAVQSLINLVTKSIYLLNCPASVKNMLHSAGLSSNILG